MSVASATVVICAYSEERWAQLTQAVESVRRQRRVADQTILVIDHNPTLLEQAGRAFPGVTTVASEGTPGLSGARNTGIAEASGDVIAFLDDDAEADPAWLETLLAAYTDPTVLGVGGGIDPVWALGRPPHFPEEFDWVVGCSYRGLPLETASVRNMIGANMSCRRSVFSTVGGFRESLGRVGRHPLGCEETELCLRARAHWPDGVFLYEPRARVRHHVSAQRGTFHYFRQRCWSEGLSKVAVSGYVGRNDALASERDYVVHTLPGGVARGLADLLRRGDVGGLGRAAWIAAGLTWTSAGFVTGSLRLRRAAAPADAPTFSLVEGPA